MNGVVAASGRPASLSLGLVSLVAVWVAVERVRQVIRDVRRRQLQGYVRHLYLAAVSCVFAVGLIVAFLLSL